VSGKFVYYLKLLLCQPLSPSSDRAFADLPAFFSGNLGKFFRLVFLDAHFLQGVVANRGLNNGWLYLRANKFQATHHRALKIFAHILKAQNQKVPALG
jgi:hypothetical protein